MVELKEYFAERTFAVFDIFVPKKLPRDLAEAITYGHKEVQDLVSRFDLNPEAASSEWTTLLSAMIEESRCCDLTKQPPEQFSPLSLKKTYLPWGSTIQCLIRIVLVLLANSADAERSFSIMNHIKYDRRACLTGENLDHLVSLRINGPEELDRLPSAKYAKAWVDSGHLKTDDPARQSKRPLPEEPIEEDEDDTGKILLKTQIF